MNEQRSEAVVSGVSGFTFGSGAETVEGREEEGLTLDLGAWEGPLDLLLALARAQKVDLKAISVLALVDQYLAYVERGGLKRLERAADYLVMAAWLTYLKSALLLPRETLPDPDPEWLAAQLAERLRRLDGMREAAGRLMAGERLGRDVFTRGAAEGLIADHRHVWPARLHDLLTAYGAVKARQMPVLHAPARPPRFTLEGALARVGRQLEHLTNWVSLGALVPPASPAEWSGAVATTLVAALEWARRGRLDLRQMEPFGPVMVVAMQRETQA